jgi:hypothetical protein
MTIKDIAEIAQVSSETVRAKGKELYPTRFENGRKTVFTKAEAMNIMSELRKKGFIQPTENLYPAIQQNDTNLDAAFKAAIIGISAMVNSLDSRMTNIEARIGQRQALLPAPQVKPRDNVSRIVRKYAHDNGLEHGSAWVELYREFGYRTNSNPRTAASNRKMAVIDYIETEGMMGLLESIAIEWGK